MSRMIKKGVYCSKNQKEAEDKHGGTTIKVPYYNHLCFYVPEKLVGFYGGSKIWLNPFLNKTFRYSGELLEVSEHEVSFIINDPYNQDKLFFHGTISQSALKIRAIRQSEPDKVWLEDEFEYIGTGESES